ncbi:MAG: type II secretion system protein GspJ [Mariprofundaceae bacterium]|nr:type II secretion system protein GspJ [Mariprofundaceae bacterium]
MKLHQKNSNIDGTQVSKGFTLLELLMALVIFALIIVVCYTALGPAGEGFRQLQQLRDNIESSSWLGKQLRSDIGTMTSSSLKKIPPLQIKADARGDVYVDELIFLSREANKPGLTLIHYKLDESQGTLLRESRMAWARPNTASDSMNLGKYESFHVEVMTPTGQWTSQWPPQTSANAAIIWAKALRITVQHDHEKQHWLIPIFAGLP